MAEEGLVNAQCAQPEKPAAARLPIAGNLRNL